MSTEHSDESTAQTTDAAQVAQAQEMTARELEKLQLSGKFDHTTDVERLAVISPHPPGDQVDRMVVAGGMIKSASLWAIRLVVIGFFLYLLGEIIGSFWRGILPVVLSLIVCTVLAPVASTLRKFKVPSALAAIISLLLFVFIAGGIFSFVAPDFARQSQSLYLQAVEGIQRLQLWAQGPPLELNASDIGKYVDEIANWIQQQAGSIAGSFISGVGTATSVVITLVVMTVMTFFFLKDGHKFLPWIRQATSRRAGWHLTEALTRGWNSLGGYIRAQALVSLIDAVFIGAGLYIIGVPLAMTLAIITFVAGFIPLVGAIVAGALSVLIALVSLGFTEALIVLGLVLLVQQLEGNVLSPWLQSKAMNLHPVIVLISVTVGGALFNLIGAFLAVPAAAMIAVFYRYIQDMLQLQSGEKKASDIEFATVAGYLAGRYNEAQGTRRRKLLSELPENVQSPAVASAISDVNNDGVGDALEQLVDVDATPSNTAANKSKGKIEQARDFFEHLLDPRDRDR